MDTGTRQLLDRWERLRSGTGLARATSASRALWLIGLALFFVVVLGLYYRLPPAALVAASAVMGWVIAERNALKARLAQWATISSYIDWERVRNDLGGE